MELGDYVRIFARRWRLIVALTVLGVIVAAVITGLTPKRYAAEARLFVGPANGNSATSAYQLGQYISQRMSSYTQLGSSGRVLNPVIRSLGLHESVYRLSQDVAIAAPAGTDTLDVTVTRVERAQAVDIARAVATQLSTVIEDLENGGSSTTRSPIEVSITENAISKGGPVAPRPALNLVLGLLSGLVLGALLGIVRDQLDRTVRSVGDAERVTALPVLGTLPYSRKLRRRGIAAADDSVVDACRELRANLSVATDGFPRTLAVLSPADGDGRSTVAAMLATVLARGGLRTCVVEADFRRPSLATMLQVRSFPGLADVLDESAGLDEALTEYQGTTAHVVVAGGIGKTGVTALLGTDAFDLVLARLAEQFDIVIVDVPPVLTFADGLLVARRTEATLLVARPGSTNRDALRAVVPALTASRARIAGIALNAARSRTVRAGAAVTMVAASAAAAEALAPAADTWTTSGFVPPAAPELLAGAASREARAVHVPRRDRQLRRRIPGRAPAAIGEQQVGTDETRIADRDNDERPGADDGTKGTDLPDDGRDLPDDGRDRADDDASLGHARMS